MTDLPTIQVTGLSSRLSLRTNFTWTFAGNMVYAASQWGVLVVLAKLGSPEMVGQFALGLAITAPVILFANLQLRSVQATDTRAEYTFGDYLGLRLLSTVVAYGAIIAIVVLSGYRQETALVILLIGLAKSFEAISDVIFGLLQRHERMDRIAKSLMIEGPVTLVVMGIILYLTESIVWAVAGMAVVWALQLALYDVRSAVLILRGDSPRNDWRLICPRVHLHTLRHLSWLALPLGVSGMLVSLNFNIPRYVIERFLGKDQLGIFAAMAYLMVAGNTVVSALAQSANPRLAKYYSNNNSVAFRNLLMRLLIIGVSMGLFSVIVVYFAGESLLNLFYGSEYATMPDVFVCMAIVWGVSFIVSFMRYAIIAAHVFKLLALIDVVSVLVTLSLSLLLVPGSNLKVATTVLIVVGFINLLFLSTIILWILNKLSDIVEKGRRCNEVI